MAKFPIAFLLMLLTATNAGATPCESIFKEIPGAQAKANANAWANWRGNAGSISAESKRLLSDADKALEKLNQPTDLCPAECKPTSSPRIIFKSVPSSFLTEYSDKVKCAGLLAQTTQKPLTYPGRKFPDMDALNGWFGEFSQGKGSDGKDLYAKCDGDCSPQYSCTINKGADGKLSLDAHVICGHARDKDQNSYDLSYVYRWECLPK